SAHTDRVRRDVAESLGPPGKEARDVAVLADAEQRRVEAADPRELSRIRPGPTLGAEPGRDRTDPVVRDRHVREPQRPRELLGALRVTGRHAALVAEIDRPLRPVRVDPGEACIEALRRRAAGQHDRVPPAGRYALP